MEKKIEILVECLVFICCLYPESFMLNKIILPTTILLLNFFFVRFYEITIILLDLRYKILILLIIFGLLFILFL